MWSFYLRRVTEMEQRDRSLDEPSSEETGNLVGLLIFYKH